MLPFAVVLENTAPQTAFMYGLRVQYTRRDGTVQPGNQRYRGGNYAIPPKGKRLVAELFNLAAGGLPASAGGGRFSGSGGPTASLNDSMESMFAGWLSMVGDVVSVQVEVDSVQFDDGRFAGPDEMHSF